MQVFFVIKHTTPQWVIRLRLALRAGYTTWARTKGVELSIGDTINLHYKYELVRAPWPR